MSRLIALLILILPGIGAVYGVKWMRDTLFNYLNEPFPFLWMQFTTGLLAFLVGVAFIGGWIFYRDRKRHYVAKRYRNPDKKQ